MSGKGDKRRPEDRAKIAANWEKIFGNKDKKAKPTEPQREKDKFTIDHESFGAGFP